MMLVTDELDLPFLLDREPLTKTLTPLQLISIANNSKERKFRQRADDLPTPKLLARVEQLRLLSKLEELKLLSLLQNNGRAVAFATAAALVCTRDHRTLTSVASDGLPRMSVKLQS
jgi:hypothetical protein